MKTLVLTLGLTGSLLGGCAEVAFARTIPDFLQPVPSGYTVYGVWEDHSALAFNATTGEWIGFDPDAPTGAAHGWHQSQWLGRTTQR